MSVAESSFKKELKDKSLVYEQESSLLSEKHKALLSESMKKYTDLKEDHDEQVKDLFENIGTLKFTKEMRFFKK
jgi:regulatory protein YycH of two-component signal transduction system YycFG